MSTGDAPSPTEEFKVTLRHTDSEYDQPYSLFMPHQCDGWEIASGPTLESLLPNINRLIDALLNHRTAIELRCPVIEHEYCEHLYADKEQEQ